ncbi:Threonine dehydrogenase [Raineyella antarctica]|uniref:Threonine dehydrogenase n=1 Tax=Raineyella antarctica TaxID=1577474 RepID=A0A1G6GH23_9ACTN|nr:zinc-dependent alcohol dehydrogenase family protein [Raineyella antarctica]SDB81123.1 Threonine dehydrogenase [Raineyella antarctica]
MRATVIHGPHDIRLEQVPDPVIQEPTDAVIRTVAACVCGSDLWRYRGVAPVKRPARIGHEYVGVVESVGDAVTTVRPGQFVVGPFYSCDGTCPHCHAGFSSVCDHLDWYDGCQADAIRIPQADGTLVALDERPDDALVPSVLALSDVMGTGWHAAEMAAVRPGMTVVVVGDGAVGLCGVIAAKVKGAERIIVISRNAPRQALARELGATDIVAERGQTGVERVRELTGGIGADAVLECVGTADSIKDALDHARPGAMVGFVGVPHDSDPSIATMFARNVGLRGGMAPVRNYLPELLPLVLDGSIDPGRVFDLTLPLDQVAEAYAAMDERRAIKVLLRP